ncbi:MAG TPA: tRNA (guanosine(37)-N1)-methyltransferase TrmD [Chloroflexota bacterium]|nr:tRNA (guanosine(37)-N1)-methyltransferase TrmD [Chloroflexota bacterium]
MRIDILTLFPGMFDGPLAHGVVGRAIGRGLLEVSPLDIRQFATDRHRSVDDYPYGGGPGMVMMPGPIFAAVESLALPEGTPVILMSPQGRVFSQQVARDLAAQPRLVLICGHYEGVDERVREHLVTDEISIGDYVLSGGEIPAMAVTDAVARLLPGAMDEQSGLEESHASGLLEYPQYTRPASFRGWEVPPILLSGNHGEVAKWRRLQALRRTFERRPELLDGAPLSVKERELVRQWQEGN